MEALARKIPRKQPGQGRGPRTLNGHVLDVRTAAAFLGMTEKTLRGMVGRQLVPFRRLNSRIILLRSELESFLVELPGCAPEQARANQEARNG